MTDTPAITATVQAEGRRGALVGDDAARQLAERLIVALSHVLCWGGSQQDLCSHAAQALASTLAEAWPDAHSNSGKVLATLRAFA